MQLKYLFRAEYLDGTTFSQPENDLSTQDPKRSAFYDVAQEKLSKFYLLGEGHTYLVDLITGHFEVDGRELWLGSNLPPVGPKRLIFYRQRQHIINPGDGSEIARNCRYCLGWQATVDGKNVQETLGVF